MQNGDREGGGGEERVIVSLKVNFKGNTVVPWIILPLESNYSVTQLCEKLFSGELSDDRHKTSDAHEPNNFQKSFRKIKTKNKNPTYLPIFFRSII